MTKFALRSPGPEWERAFLFWWQPKPKIPVVKVPVHWAPSNGLPYCGAVTREKWTPWFEFATCSTCKRDGYSLILQHEVNNR